MIPYPYTLTTKSKISSSSLKTVREILVSKKALTPETAIKLDGQIAELALECAKHTDSIAMTEESKYYFNEEALKKGTFVVGVLIFLVLLVITGIIYFGVKIF